MPICDTHARARHPVRLLGLALTFALTALALTACAANEGEEHIANRDGGAGVAIPAPGIEPEVSQEAPMPEIGIPPTPPREGAGPDAALVPDGERLIVRTHAVRLRVENVEVAVDGVREAVGASDGLIVTVQISSDDVPVFRHDASGTLADGAPLVGFITARIPPDEVDRFTEAVGELGTVVRRTADEADVTQEHLDLGARLENVRIQESRLRDLFDRAEKIEDLLEIERELARVRGEIESLEVRITHLERQTAMATVTVELQGREAVVAPVGDDWGFVAAVRAGIRGLVGTVNALIYVTLTFMPLFVLGATILLVVKALLKRRARTRAGVGAVVTEARDATGEKRA